MRPMRPMRVLAIVNSEGGSGRAGEIDAEELRGLFRDAGMPGP